MPSTPRAKVSKQIRAKMRLTKEDILIDLAESWRYAKGQERIDLGLALMPYVMPKLMVVDVKSTQNVQVAMKIGGTE